MGVPHRAINDDVVAVRLGVGGNPWSSQVWGDVIEPVPDIHR